MNLEYPLNVVWYIETRPWSGTKAIPGFAPEVPSRMGSGVVVELEQLDPQGQPFQPQVIRKYLLTCSHVVREPVENATQWGNLLEEIRRIVPSDLLRKPMSNPPKNPT